MRDFITIRQKAFYDFLSNYNKDKPKNKQIKLDLKDLVIFEYIAQFCLSDNEKIKNNRIVVNDREYTHIAYKKIIEDNPFLDFNTINPSKILAKRLNKLFKLNLLDKYFAKENGNKTYFSLLPQGYTLITTGLEGVSSQGYKAYNPQVSRDITTGLDNSNINIDNKNSNKKIESKNSFFNLYIGAKNFLGVIFNLKDLGLKYGLRAYKEREYLKAYKKLLDKGYGDSEIITSIYARMYKATMEEVDTFKFLQTIINPKYLVKSIDQLISEKNAIVEELMEIYQKGIDIIEDDKLPYQVLMIIYYDDYKAVRELINDEGYFEDVMGYEYHLKDLEYYIYLMTKFLSKYDIELLPSIKSLIIGIVKSQLSFEEFLKRLLYGLIYLEDKNQLEQLQAYNNSDELAILYKNIISGLEINQNLDEVVEELEKRIIVE